MCFNNTILMTKLEGKLLLSRWSLSALNFPSSGYLHRISGMHLQKDLVYLCTNTFLLPLLHFWNYNLSPNGQTIFFIDTQAHLQTQILRVEWYKVLKITHCRISPIE